PGNGCEAHVASDLANCGACGTSCPTAANTAFACTNGVCTISACSNGARSCDDTIQNGCECAVTNGNIACANDAPDAGADGAAPTDAAPNDAAPFGGDAGPGANCIFAGCQGTFADCNANLVADGCEADLATDAKNCGTCGVSCEGSTCVAGRCQPVKIIAMQ